MYEEILVPTDGSSPSLGALDEAAELAASQDATIHVVYVLDATMLGDVGDVTVLESLEETAENAVERAVARAEEAGVAAVEGTVERGTPHRTILQYIDDHDIDLVVMGTHGRTGLNRLLLGSVTEKLVRLSPVPVLTIRPEDEPEEAGTETPEGTDEP